MDKLKIHRYVVIAALTVGGIMPILSAIFPANGVLSVATFFVTAFFMTYAIRSSVSFAQSLVAAGVLALSILGHYVILYADTSILLAVGICLAWAALTVPAMAFDAWIARKTDSIWTLFILPALMTAIDMISLLLNIGNMFSLTSTLYPSHSLIQCISYISEYGFSFLIYSSVSLAVYHATHPHKKGILAGTLCIVIPLCMSIFGWIRLAGAEEPDYTIRTAVLLTIEIDYDDEEAAPLDISLEFLEKNMRDAAAQGAEFIVTHEEYLAISAKDEPELIAGMSRIVADVGIPSLLGAQLLVEDTDEFGNALYFFDADGTLLDKYDKHNKVPLLEEGMYEGSPKPGSAECNIAGHDIRISYVICFDGNDPVFVHSCDPGTDLLVIPCFEWPGADFAQARKIGIRALENHVTMLKPTYDGFTLVVDPYGRETTRIDTRGTYAQVVMCDLELNDIVE